MEIPCGGFFEKIKERLRSWLGGECAYCPSMKTRVPRTHVKPDWVVWICISVLLCRDGRWRQESPWNLAGTS